MANKNHLRILADRQLEESSEVKFYYGFPKDDDGNSKEPNYAYMAQRLRGDLTSFSADLEIKRESRSEEIKVPFDIDYLEIDFFDQYDIEKYYTIWFNEFGLEGVNFSNFNRTGLFAVSDKEKFESFIASINGLVKRGIENEQDSKFSKYILYIKTFKLLTASDIIKFGPEFLGNVVLAKTFDLPLDEPMESQLLDALEAFLQQEEIEFTLDREVNRLEINSASYAMLQTIAENFDIIESITCSQSSIVRPGTFNIPTREYGFTIANSEEDLPLIGIMDTGISMDTPLASITLKDDNFTIDGHPLIDIYGTNRHGHGTAVAALAALGRYNHLNQFEGEVNADAKLLSIKLIENGKSYLSEKKIIEMLYRAKEKYPHLGIFVLTISYNQFKPTNESYSNYTYELDKFAYSTDSLLFISTGNNDAAFIENIDYDLKYFEAEHTNLCTPADCLNNITIGAAADGLSKANFSGISNGKEFPTLYSRKGHTDLKSLYPQNKSNKNLFKPDILESGGDLGYYDLDKIDYMEEPAMTILSANPAFGVTKDVGTSLAAPLAANLAAKIKIVYPNLKSQTIKALIINSASLKNIKFQDDEKDLLSYTAGNGYLDLETTLFSNENRATLILEDSIQNGEQKIYPINFPQYLIDMDLGKKNRILKVSATLCFSFLPIKHNQLSYCPIHMAFSVFKNHTSDQINRKKKELDSNLRRNLNWSQSGRHKSKPVPYSNSQKINFTIDTKQLKDEDCTFKLAVQALLSTQIIASELENYPENHAFSLVLRIEEDIKNSTSKLYDEIKLINHLEVITSVEAEGYLEA